jgi:hypothetical protein
MSSPIPQAVSYQPQVGSVAITSNAPAQLSAADQKTTQVAQQACQSTAPRGYKKRHSSGPSGMPIPKGLEEVMERLREEKAQQG